MKPELLKAEPIIRAESIKDIKDLRLVQLAEDQSFPDIVFEESREYVRGFTAACLRMKLDGWVKKVKEVKG